MRFYKSTACLVLMGLLFGCTAKPHAPDAGDLGPDAVYYLVRHAEKTTENDDPGLTEAGYKRAEDLATRLANVPLTKIYSSDYIRTRDTAAPVAAAKSLGVVIYDPRALESFANKLLTETGHILIVGHSNTTPSLSEYLGGEGGEPIIEATEYDRFYVLTRNAAVVTSVIEKFGVSPKL